MPFQLEYLNNLLVGFFLSIALIQLIIIILNKSNYINVLLFSIALLSAVFVLLSGYCHLTNDPIKHLGYYNLFFLIYLILMFLIIILTQEFNKDIKNKFFYYLAICSIVITALIHLTLKNGIVYQEILALKTLSNSTFIEDYYLPEGKINVFYPFFMVWYFISIFLYYFSILIYNYRKKEKQQVHIIISLLIIFISSNLYDSLIDIGLISSIFITDYAVIPIVILFNYEYASKITDYLKTNEKLIEANQKFSDLIESVELFIIGQDTDGKIIYLNTFTKKKYFYGMDVYGQNIKEYLVNLEKSVTQNTIITTLKVGNIKEAILSITKIKLNTSEGNLNYYIGYDITDKTLNEKQLLLTLKELEKVKNELTKENIFLKYDSNKKNNDSILQTKNKSYQKVIDEIYRIRNLSNTVLLEGETGVGKRFIANTLVKISNRKDRPFTTFNCNYQGQSSLFNFLRKSFKDGNLVEETGLIEMLDNGTLLINEVSGLSLKDQIHLYDFLASRREKSIYASNVRLIVTTSKDLKVLVEEGKFDNNLYYCLNLYSLNIPSLMNHIEDIPLLVEKFIFDACSQAGIPEMTVTLKTIKQLQSYNWPGNIRELKYVIERAVLTSPGKKLILKEVISEEPPKIENEGFKTLLETEKEHILKVLQFANWKISGKNSASVILGIKESTLRAKMKKLEIQKGK
ncbi:sigma 54-interacting transcriptional regulator [Flammeovirga yaeyamensis]|uniref:Sigma 54-interacting transcriptional regulator n=1 Tax=Flammeovirga yaeyamensis TaxID=367791 RepID=A0AAX1N7H2_9BACT|nr:sigma 54-interacting transcriptional regulator [Flammeovirga yaeyamensis]MBB3700546.1 DNA-binding NtrC family response regulator/PAS domain-containing protein [Flammeovirga yaeyamensis]NMF37663.1 sigma-54-dependent Fis family transcriptional regulator [Flammeovirga yaeyamensis]QWG01972.1 sigma 54-interacting transcriptional regulator [Flammeovirga yaeyamensis]